MFGCFKRIEQPQNQTRIKQNFLLKEQQQDWSELLSAGKRVRAKMGALRPCLLFNSKLCNVEL